MPLFLDIFPAGRKSASHPLTQGFAGGGVPLAAGGRALGPVRRRRLLRACARFPGGLGSIPRLAQRNTEKSDARVI